MKKRAFLFAMAAACGLMLFGCGETEPEVPATTEPVVVSVGEEGEKPEVPETAEEEPQAAEEETKEGCYRSELTNEWIDEALENQRPIAAMVDNELTALDHFGVNDCDIVYEMTNSAQNGGITRLMCIMKDWSKITQLGSIRSVRPTNLQIAPEYGAVVCHDGGPFWIDTFLKNDFVYHFSGTFSRVNNGKSREFTEYILPGDLDKNFSNSKVTKEYDSYYQGGAHFNFASESNPVDLSANSDSKDAVHIELPFEHNKSTLDYDSAKGLYMYSEYGKKHVDGKTGEQTGWKNAIILSAQMNVLDDHGYMQFYVNNISNREGFYATEGKMIPITWSKENDLSYTKYFDKSGNELKINTGKTYIAIVPEKDFSKLSVE